MDLDRRFARLLRRAAPLAGTVYRSTAILVRSAADRTGQNLVVFVDNLRPGSSLAVIAPDRLAGA